MRLRQYKHSIYTAFIALLFIASFTILFWLAYRERDVLLSYEWELRWSFAGISFILFTLAFGTAAAIWTDIMRSFGSETTFIDHFRYFGFSQLAKRLPGTVWYFLGREYFYKQQSEMPWLASVASMLELVVSTIAGSILAAILVTKVFWGFSYNYLVGFLLLLAGAFFLAHPWTIQQILHRMNISVIRRPRYRRILGWIGAYLIVWALGGITFWAITNTFVVVQYSNILFFVGAWCLVGVLSTLVLLLPTNLGFSEFGLSLFLAYLFPLPLAITLAILSRISFMLYDIGVATLIVLSYTILRRFRYLKTTERQL